jgi:hypothetical protein
MSAYLQQTVSRGIRFDFKPGSEDLPYLMLFIFKMCPVHVMCAQRWFLSIIFIVVAFTPTPPN